MKKKETNWSGAKGNLDLWVKPKASQPANQPTNHPTDRTEPNRTGPGRAGRGARARVCVVWLDPSPSRSSLLPQMWVTPRATPLGSSSQAYILESKLFPSDVGLNKLTPKVQVANFGHQFLIQYGTILDK